MLQRGECDGLCETLTLYKIHRRNGDLSYLFRVEPRCKVLKLSDASDLLIEGAVACISLVCKYDIFYVSGLFVVVECSLFLMCSGNNLHALCIWSFGL